MAMEITTTMIVDDDHEIREFTCFTCRKRFPLISDLTKHLKTEHTLASIVDAGGSGDGGGKGGGGGGGGELTEDEGDREGGVIGGEEPVTDGSSHVLTSDQIVPFSLYSAEKNCGDPESSTSLSLTPPGQREKKFFCGFVQK